MKKLSIKINHYFNNSSKYNVDKIIISCSDEAGDGEHKIYEFIRNNSNHDIDFEIYYPFPAKFKEFNL